MTNRYGRVPKVRRLTGLEVVGLIAFVLFLLDAFMIGMACWASLSPSMRAEAQVTTGQAWTASLVTIVLFSGWMNVMLGLSKRRND